VARRKIHAREVRLVALDQDWIPCRVVWELNRPHIDCCYLGGARFTEPLFAGTIARALERPFSAAFQRHLPIEALEAREQVEEQAGNADPAGFIFHMSRSGADLISKMLKAIPGVTVFSQAPPVDSIVRAPERAIEASEAQHTGWLRAIIRALGRGVSSEHRPYFIETDCWHALDLPLYCRAFPATQWIFLYRDPREVLASYASYPAEWTLPGYLKAERFGFDPATVEPAALAEYRARLLAGLLRKVAECELPLGTLVNYSQLPDWGRTTMPHVFGLGPIAPDAVEHADDPRSVTLTPEIERLCEAHLSPLYKILEAKRSLAAVSHSL
jgi:hypothetical protein